MKKYAAAAVAAVTLIVALPAAANATVLYKPPHNITVCSCIAIESWYQSYSGGSPYISAYVTKNGPPVSRPVTAPGSGRAWGWKPVLCPQTTGRSQVHFKTRPTRWTDSVY